MGQAEGEIQQALLLGAMKSLNERKWQLFKAYTITTTPGRKNRLSEMIQPQAQLCGNGKQKAHEEQTTQRKNTISFSVNTQDWKRMLQWDFHGLCSFVGRSKMSKMSKISQNTWQDNVTWLLGLVMLVLSLFKCFILKERRSYMFLSEINVLF